MVSLFTVSQLDVHLQLLQNKKFNVKKKDHILG